MDETKTTSIQFAHSDYENLAKLAKEDERSINSYILVAIKRGLNDEKLILGNESYTGDKTLVLRLPESVYCQLDGKASLLGTTKAKLIRSYLALN